MRSKQSLNVLLQLIKMKTVDIILVLLPCVCVAVILIVSPIVMHETSYSLRILDYSVNVCEVYEQHVAPFSGKGWFAFWVVEMAWNNPDGLKTAAVWRIDDFRTKNESLDELDNYARFNAYECYCISPNQTLAQIEDLLWMRCLFSKTEVEYLRSLVSVYQAAIATWVVGFIMMLLLVVIGVTVWLRRKRHLKDRAQYQDLDERGEL